VSAITSPTEASARVTDASATDVPVPGTDAPSPATDAPSPATDAPSPATDAPAPATGASASAADLLALDRQVCFALAVASRDVIALYKPLLAPLGLTHPQYLVMLALWEEAPLKVSDLAGRLSLEPPTLSPLLKRLEARGMVTRRRDPRDERALAVTLTPAGVAARAEAEKIPPAVLARLGMDVGDLERLRDLLGRLVAAARTVR
jgi:MarR family transcriptional regulator, organic hydroperoxide resistance regulator